jgi:predicted nucleic acid-binding protein
VKAPPIIFLDSGPLGLLMQRRGLAQADACRAWLSQHIGAGVRFIVPEIIDYELRRELLRLGHHFAISRLDAFLNAAPDRLLPLTTVSVRRAAEIWAEFRKQGIPTAAPDALDVDVLLAGQALSTGYLPQEFVVATTNVQHLSRVVPAVLWGDIE